MRNPMTTTRKQTPAPTRKSALDSDLTPLYAVAGLTEVAVSTLADVAVTTVRSTLAVTQEVAADRVSSLRALPNQLKLLPGQMKGLPEQTRARLTDVQRQAGSYLAEANAVYAELAGRGKRVVDDTVVAARKVSGVAGRQVSQVRAGLADAVDPAFEAAQEGVTSARRATTGRSATRTTTPRSAAKAAATRRTAAQAPASKRSTSKAATANRTASEAPSTKATPAKAPAKRAPETKKPA